MGGGCLELLLLVVLEVDVIVAFQKLIDRRMEMQRNTLYMIRKVGSGGGGVVRGYLKLEDSMFILLVCKQYKQNPYPIKQQYLTLSVNVHPFPHPHLLCNPNCFFSAFLILGIEFQI